MARSIFAQVVKSASMASLGFANLMRDNWREHPPTYCAQRGSNNFHSGVIRIDRVGNEEETSPLT